MSTDTPAFNPFGDTDDGNSLDAVTSPYDQLGVDATMADIMAKCEKLTKNLMRLYIPKDMIGAHSFIDDIREIESTNLQGLMKKTVYLNHMVDSLMKHLDTTGIDIENYQVMAKLSVDSIEIMNEFTKYVRNIPSVFRSIKTELEEIASTNDIIGLPPHNNQNDLPANADTTGQIYALDADRGNIPTIDGIDRMINDVECTNNNIQPEICEEMPEEYKGAGEKEKLNRFEEEDINMGKTKTTTGNTTSDGA